jgi:hypothetical protein
VRAYAVAAAEPAAGKQVEIVKEAHGFELVRHQFVREYDSNVCLYRHKKTGEPPVAGGSHCYGTSMRICMRTCSL